MPTDVQYERTFAETAYTALREKAPGLLPHLIGFKLIDKNDEGNHAVGAFGFKVGPQDLIAPVFFLNGELKGNELLFIPNQQMFVPLQENYVNYLTHRKPYVLGEVEELPISQLHPVEPDFNIFNQTPRTKTASAHSFNGKIASFRAEFKPVMTPFLADSPEAPRFREAVERSDLTSLIKRADRRMAISLIKTMQKDEDFANAVLKFYSAEKFASMASDFRAAFSKMGADGDRMIVDPPEVSVMFYGDEDRAGEMMDLTDKEKERLMRDQVLIRDNREDGEVSQVYPAQVTKLLTNPDHCGMYEVLTRPGRFRNLVVIVGPVRPQIENRRNSETNLVVVDPDSGVYGNFKAHNVFVKKKLDDLKDWNERFDKLPGLDSIKPKDAFVLINRKMSGSCVLVAEDVSEGEDGTVEIKVHTRTDEAVTDPILDRTSKNYIGSCGYGWGSTSHAISTKKPGDRIICNARDLFVPDGVKVIKLKKEFDEEDRINPGTLADVHLEIVKMARSMKVYFDGLEYHLTSGDSHSGALTKTSALCCLVKSHGLRESDARQMLKEAELKKSARYLVKYAGRAPIAPDFPPPSTYYSSDIGAEVQLAQDPTYKTVNMPSPENIPEMSYEDRRRAKDAASLDDKGLFDVTVLKGLVETADPESAVATYLPDLMLGMDRVGRILFLFYWHNDAFKERYGREDIPKLEDSLRNVFESLGDLIMFLKQRQIEAEPGEEEARFTLESVI